MIFEDYYINSELNNWRIEQDIDWVDLDSGKIKKNVELLEKLKAACLIESHHPISTGSLLALLESDVDATAILSIEMYEGFKHFYSLKKYLDLVGHPTVGITIDEITSARQEALKRRPELNLGQDLINFMISEHFAAYFFLRVSQSTSEPVLKQLSIFISRDEFRHTQAAHDILRKIHSEGKVTNDQIMDHSYNFQHYGNQIVDEVPVFQKNDITAIQTFIRKIEAITHERMVDYVKRKKIKSSANF